MKKIRIITLSIIVILGCHFTYAQDSVTFKPSGKIIARGFLDYSVGFGHANKQNGFDITRAFLGYNYKFTRTLQAQVIIDGAAGKTSSNGNEVYLRNAFVNWNDKGFDVNVGQTGMLQFSTQEKYWMFRYVMKSFQDENKMGSSVDLGVTASYKFNPYVSADLSLTNGEGYKKIKKDNSNRYAAGLSLFPVKNIIFRVYADVYNESEGLRDALPSGVTDAQYKDQYALSLFAGYQDQKISLGAEYNKLYNKGFIENKDCDGYSFYASGKVSSKVRAFARYDLLNSTAPSNFSSTWNSQDGQTMLVGVEFQPAKQLKIAPNFRNINPDGRKAEQYLFINLEFNL